MLGGLGGSGGSLFQRLFWRAALGVGISLFVFMALFHLFQARVVDSEWREELRQEARWLGRHSTVASGGMLAGAWKTMHSSVRITMYDEEGLLVADSHPERPRIDLEAVCEGREPAGHLAVVEDLQGGGQLVMSRPYVPSFPSGMKWELGLAVVLVLGPLFLLLYPLARSMRSSLQDMQRMAREVSGGHFGKTLEVARRDELGDLARSLDDMSRKLAEAERLSTRLLHDVSHELRSPLGRIQVLAETLTHRPERSEVCLDGIAQEIALLDRLVGDLLRVARSESGTGLRMELFSLQHWATEVLERFGVGVRESGLEWRTVLPEVDIEVHGDPQQLVQALGNLVDNARSALGDRGWIEVSIEVTGELWRLAVSDNGPGIAAEHLPHLFRRFYRVDEHRDRSSGGVGLGLSVVQTIARAHGGTVEVASAPGEGTQVALVLPRSAPEARPA